jgi:hypothetical protein
MSRPSRHPHGSYKHRTSYDYSFYYHTHITLTSLIPLPVTLLSLTPYFLPPVLRRLVYNYDLDKSQMVYHVESVVIHANHPREAQRK